MTIETTGTVGVALAWGWLIGGRCGRLSSVAAAAAATVTVWYTCWLLSGGEITESFAAGAACSLTAHVWWRSHLRLRTLRQGE